MIRLSSNTRCTTIRRRARHGSLVTLLMALASSAAPAANVTDGNRIGRVATPSALEFRAMYTFDAAAKSLPDATYPYEAEVNRAHVVMLAERGIIPGANAAAILRGLETVDRRAATDPSLRAYLPYERVLIETIGPVAGKLQTGRSRNDLANTVNRMFYREQVDRLVEDLLALRTALADKAEENLRAPMVGYTQRKEAQPITLGHYLMAISESLGKTVTRYEQLRERIDLSPLGSAATAGTGWPIDRQRTAALLGFTGLVDNAIEGVAGWDHIAEFAFVDAICMTTLGRFASEIQFWSSDENGMVDLDGAYAGTSSIMPQKKNADSLEHLREHAANALGFLTAIISSLQAAEYQQSAVRVALQPRAIDAVAVNVKVMTGIVRTLHPDETRMRMLAATKFSTMTELADTLVREGGIAFREAHEIIARVVDQALARGRTADQIDLAMIEEAAQAQIGHPVQISADSIKAALDPAQNVGRRDGIGGPAEPAVRSEIGHSREEIAAATGRLSDRRSRLDNARRDLATTVAKIIPD